MRPPARRHPADDPYAAPPAPGNGHWPPAQYPDPAHVSAQQGQGYHFPPESEPNFGYGQQQQGYDRFQQAAPDPYAQQQWDQGDPRAYDLGNYMPNGQQAYPPAGPPPFHQGANANETFAQHGYAETEGEYDDEFVDEEPGRGRRWMFIVAALVGAVGVGGALAYTYKSFIAPSGRVPLVRADPNVKARPETRNVAPNDKRMQGRLGEDSGGQQQAAAPAGPDAQEERADEQGGPRRVRTIPITPGGGPPGVQVAPPAAPQAGPPAAGVPGIMLDNMGPRPQQQAAPKPAPPPQRVTIGQPPPAAAPPSQAEEPPPPPMRRATVAAVPPPAAKPAPPPKVAAAPPPTASTGAGYVAVLSSQKTRMDALKAFADLQQKYGEALSNRVPDVQEANLGEKGIWYRVVVGPPGSREAANGVCSQLKSAGYAHCWVNAY
jgi:hypothetical protein